MPSPRPFSRATLTYNRMEVSICPDCGLMIAASSSQQVLKAAEKAHRKLHRKPVRSVLFSRRRTVHGVA